MCAVLLWIIYPSGSWLFCSDAVKDLGFEDKDLKLEDKDKDLRSEDKDL